MPPKNARGSLTLKNDQLNISQLADLSAISRTTAYKYKALLEAKTPESLWLLSGDIDVYMYQEKYSAYAIEEAAQAGKF